MGACRNLLRLQAYLVRIEVLSAEAHGTNGGTQVPKDCDLTNFPACRTQSGDPSAESIMLVQDTDGKSFRMECITDSRWSPCAPLPVEETREVRKDKHAPSTALFASPALAPAPSAGFAPEVLAEKVKCNFNSRSWDQKKTQPRARSPQC
jgi:hypothetical protein